MSKYVVMVINDIFEDENMLIVKKGKGDQRIIRYDEQITSEELHRYLESSSIDVDSCDIVVVDNDWKGNPKVSKY